MGAKAFVVQVGNVKDAVAVKALGQVAAYKFPLGQPDEVVLLPQKYPDEAQRPQDSKDGPDV